MFGLLLIYNMPGLTWKSAWVFKPASVGSHVSPTFWRICVEVSVGDIVGCAPRLIAGGCAMGCGMGCLGLRDGLFGLARWAVWQVGTAPLAMR